eukprot:scaffold309505_cov18-Prasinocladus_malaysianus.AAC.1
MISRQIEGTNRHARLSFLLQISHARGVTSCRTKSPSHTSSYGELNVHGQSYWPTTPFVPLLTL